MQKSDYLYKGTRSRNNQNAFVNKYKHQSDKRSPFMEVITKHRKTYQIAIEDIASGTILHMTDTYATLDKAINESRDWKLLNAKNSSSVIEKLSRKIHKP